MRVSGCRRLPVPPARITPFIARDYRSVRWRLRRLSRHASRPTACGGGPAWRGRPRFRPAGAGPGTGPAWVPLASPHTAGAGGAGIAVGIILAFAGVIAFVSFLVLIILLTMGNQIKNVFDNVVTALGS